MGNVLFVGIDVDDKEELEGGRAKTEDGKAHGNGLEELPRGRALEDRKW